MGLTDFLLVCAKLHADGYVRQGRNLHGNFVYWKTTERDTYAQAVTLDGQLY